MNGNWIPIINDVIFQNFHLQSNNNLALINLNLSRKNCKMLNLIIDDWSYVSTFKDANEAFKQYLHSQGKKSTNLLGINRELRYSESSIEIDEEIAVMGIGKWKQHKTSKSNDSNEKILMLYGTEKRKLYITDVPKAIKSV
jgi:hypothetical protein